MKSETVEQRWDRLRKLWLSKGNADGPEEPDYDAVTLGELCDRARNAKEGR